MTLVDTAAVDNALIDQKNAITRRINESETAEELEAVKQNLAFLSDLWSALGYAYKTRELRLRVKGRAAELAHWEEEHLAQIDKPRRKELLSLRARIGALESIAGGAC